MVNIVVCAKYVPDATGDRHFAEDLTTDRDAVDGSSGTPVAAEGLATPPTGEPNG
jgi:hypothetical protein